MEKKNMRDESTVIEGRNAVLEAIRSGQTVERVFILQNSYDGPIHTILREARKKKIRTDLVSKQRLDEMSSTGKHQGVIAYIPRSVIS